MRGTVCALCASLLLVGACASHGGISAPLLAWSSRQLLGQGQHSSRTVYQSANAVESASEVVLGSLGKRSALSPSGEEPADLVVVYLGSQVDATTLRKGSQLKQLSSLLDAAQSSLVMPFLQFKGSSLDESMRAQLQQLGVGFQAIGCTGLSSDLAAEVQQAAASGDSGLQVLLVCISPPGERSSPEALQAEMDRLAAVHDVLEASGKRVVHLYASTRSSAARGRMLQSTSTGSLTGFGQYQTCGPLCQTQVRWLEGMLGVTVLTLAAIAGMTCLYMLNTPSRFETQKEATSS